MNLPTRLHTHLEDVLGQSILRVTSIGGGCIAHACRVTTASVDYFLKYGNQTVAATFAAEAEGLQALRKAASPLQIPDVVATQAGIAELPGFLLLTWLETHPLSKTGWETLGTGLAELHAYTNTRYGFDNHNFIGASPQVNDWHRDWPTFFRTQRLAPQIRQARTTGRWRTRWNPFVERLYAKLPALLPTTPPASLLHGDLWNGNVLGLAKGQAALIDPAVYYGDHETDLAMSELFGGFAPRFYDAYAEAWPLEADYAERRDLYNLYHLLNHLNLFGSSYAGSVERILRRFA